MWFCVRLLNIIHHGRYNLVQVMVRNENDKIGNQILVLGKHEAKECYKPSARRHFDASLIFRPAS